jgi:hypothetical protein
MLHCTRHFDERLQMEIDWITIACEFVSVWIYRLNIVIIYQPCGHRLAADGCEEMADSVELML